MTFICEKLHILVVLKSETTENYLLKRNTTRGKKIKSFVFTLNSHCRIEAIGENTAPGLKGMSWDLLIMHDDCNSVTKCTYVNIFNF